MKQLILALLLSGLCHGLEPADRNPFRIPKEATQVDTTRVSFILAHKAQAGRFIFGKMAKDADFCILRSDQAKELAGAQFQEIVNLQPIMVRWNFIEPVDMTSSNYVKSYDPSLYRKDDTLYVSSKGLDIGDVGRVAEGFLIVQVEKLPRKVVHKLARLGW